MTMVTRHALRVYASLAELRGAGDDVLDALVPFFEPVLELMNGKIFEPQLLAAGVRKLYHWRFTREIAEHFIPRLARRGYLRREAAGGKAAYIVTFPSEQARSSENASITQILGDIVDEFQRFPARLTDLLHYEKSRDELTDILIRFLVTTDAFGSGSNDQGGDSDVLAALEEGGRPLSREDRYIAARFVKYISDKDPAYLPHLARLASIGLLTEVVDDFLKPVNPVGAIDLTVAVDAPLALDYLGLSGKALQDDVRSVFDALRKIGCKFIVFPITCEEMQRNLRSMLSLPIKNRHGYTHEAMLRGEVLGDYVEAVARNPESAVVNAGLQIRSLTLDQFPNSHVYFNQERYEDFFSYVTWVADVRPREHDATCMALVMRLRQGKHHSDLFRNGYVFATRNSTFARNSRRYCLDSRLINEHQEGPVIHQRELATIAWLRTGLGADDPIPRAHLVGYCDRVLRVRPEVTTAVAARLQKVTPEKLEQYELLLQDHRSLRRLADATLNDETVVTGENAEQLLELMREATIEEERQRFEARLREETERHRAIQKAVHLKTQKEIADREAVLAATETKLAEHAQEVAALRDSLGALESQQRISIEQMVGTINSRTRFLDVSVTVLLLLMGAAAVYDYLSEGLSGFRAWKIVLALAGLVGLYHLISDILQKPTFGLNNVLNVVGRWQLSRELRRRGMHWVKFGDFRISKGVVSYSKRVRATD